MKLLTLNQSKIDLAFFNYCLLNSKHKNLNLPSRSPFILFFLSANAATLFLVYAKLI